MGDRFEWNLIISGRNLIYKTGLNSDIFENHLIGSHKTSPLTGLRPGGEEIFIPLLSHKGESPICRCLKWRKFVKLPQSDRRGISAASSWGLMSFSPATAEKLAGGSVFWADCRWRSKIALSGFSAARRTGQ